YEGADKEEDVSDSGNKDNVGCDNSAEKVESVKAKTVNIDIKNSSKNVAVEISKVNTDKKEILEEDSEHAEGRESFGEPKLKDENRLVFDQEKISERIWQGESL
ncbi:27172_t:CDS:2, partial [Dentiscutata erythropus]